MALSGSETKDLVSSGQLKSIIEWSATQSIANNTSTVTADSYLQALYAIDIGNETGITTIAGQSESGAYRYNGSGKKLLYSVTKTIPHSADGRLTAAIVVDNLIRFTYAGTYVEKAAHSINAVLNDIPRASTITTFNDFTIGSNISWAVDRKYAAYVHKVELLIGNDVIASEVSSNAAGTLGITLAMKNQMLGLVPTATEITATLRVTTYTNISLKDQVGSVQTASAKASVGTDIVPSFTTITHSEYVSDVATKVGAYVQNLSRLILAITGAAAGAGSSIQSYEIKVAGQTATAQSATTQVITQSGSLKITGKVTDKRGRSVTKEVTISVLAYSKPTLTSYDVFRSKSDKTYDPFGSYATARYVAWAASLKVGSIEKNTLQVKVWSRVKGGSWVLKGTYPETSVTPAQRDYAYAGYLVTGEYEFKFEITDIFGATTMTTINDDSCKVATGGVPLFVGFGGLASSFGKIPTFGSTYDAEFGIKGIHSEGPITAPESTIDKMVIDNPGAAWITGKQAKAGLIPKYQTTASFHPILEIETQAGHSITLGSIGERVGFYGFKSNRTENGVDRRFIEFDIANNALYVNNMEIGAYIADASRVQSDVIGFTVAGSPALDTWRAVTLSGNLSNYAYIMLAIGAGTYEKTWIVLPANVADVGSNWYLQAISSYYSWGDIEIISNTQLRFRVRGVNSWGIGDIKIIKIIGIK